MVGAVVVMVVKETMIVAETLPSYLPRHSFHSLHLPSWSFSFTFIYPRGHLLSLPTMLFISMVLVNMGLVMIWLVVLLSLA